MNDFKQLTLARINSLIADKLFEVAIANRENNLGGWLSDHEKSIEEIDREIEFQIEQFQQS